jgi:hypothetical protein
MSANAYFEEYGSEIGLTPVVNLDTVIPPWVGRRDYLARMNERVSYWAPHGWMSEGDSWDAKTGTVEVKLHLREARVSPTSGKSLITRGCPETPAQSTNKSDIEECDALVAAQGDEQLAERYRDRLGIPVVVLDNVRGVPSFEEFKRTLC